MEKIKPIKINKDMHAAQLVAQMKNAGFGARKIGRASEILQKMVEDQECTVFLGMAGAMVPAGMKQIIIDLMKGKKITVLVTTGANLTHDLIEALGDEHYHCDTWNDEEFREKGYNRMYNVLMKNDVYKKLETFIEQHWEHLQKTKTIQEFTKVIGEILSKSSSERSPEVNSILQTAYEHDIPIYCPALADSGIGLMIWGRKAAGKEITIDAFADMNTIIDTAWTAKKNRHTLHRRRDAKKLHPTKPPILQRSNLRHTNHNRQTRKRRKQRRTTRRRKIMGQTTIKRHSRRRYLRRHHSITPHHSRLTNNRIIL